MFLLDEIDKMSMDFRGDPSSSALLEVLDPEQNSARSTTTTWTSTTTSPKVMFITTANNARWQIPIGRCKDRMEVIEHLRVHGL